MDYAKIEIKIGEIHFSGEGNPNWLEKQLDKILGKAETLINISNILLPKDEMESMVPIEPKSK